MNLTDKQAIVKEVAGVASESISAVAAFYSKLTVEEMTELRVNARKSGVYLRVVRNTLARRAVENTNFSCLKEKLVGPVILAFASQEPNAAARLMRDFAKVHTNLQVTALVIDGKLLGADQLEAIAMLPTYDEGVSILMSVMLAPVTKLARTLVAVSEQKQAAAA